jgi:hypothetical protein
VGHGYCTLSPRDPNLAAGYIQIVSEYLKSKQVPASTDTVYAKLEELASQYGAGEDSFERCETEVMRSKAGLRHDGIWTGGNSRAESDAPRRAGPGSVPRASLDTVLSAEAAAVIDVSAATAASAAATDDASGKAKNHRRQSTADPEPALPVANADSCTPELSAGSASQEARTPAGGAAARGRGPGRDAAARRASQKRVRHADDSGCSRQPPCMVGDRQPKPRARPMGMLAAPAPARAATVFDAARFAVELAGGSAKYAATAHVCAQVRRS